MKSGVMYKCGEIMSYNETVLFPQYNEMMKKMSVIEVEIVFYVKYSEI
jgi:hypothetical protein